ncbi:AraC family transcriptional regulator [Actinoplanes sichuanensis]|uniref:AraC family transcriptional regulator n=1 Tax=Actinoplanes sichuanensis TaxID=512349 RepID=A0ABW4AK13_9ACTN|nr:AraC family transcriptional regulator [Actinoplanes sichuanensis]BEL03974.1 AraC family transcriptional regulator [Actinoplanes sichuanensis]
MDPVGGLLDPRARGAFILRSLLSAPWSIRIADEAPLTLVAVVRGSVHIDMGTTTATIVPGDVAVVRRSEPYTVADSKSTAPQVTIGPDQVCRPIAGVVGARPMGPLGLRSWGNDPDGATMLLTGTYHSPAEISRSLLSALPELVVLRPGEWDSGLIEHVIREVDRDAPGQDVVLDRLLDLILITAVRTWLSRPDAHPPRWYSAQDDPIVGTALTRIHARPDQPWTVASLAAEASCSRAALARRFTELVGVPPMTYLTEWRLSCAADMLVRTDATLETIARDVGYAGPFALSAAFKRVRGVSPRTLRSATADR